MPTAPPVPRAPDEENLRTRRAIDVMASIFDSLIQSGQLVQIPGGSGGGIVWTIVQSDQNQLADEVFRSKSRYGMWGV